MSGTLVPPTAPKPEKEERECEHGVFWYLCTEGCRGPARK